MYQPSIFCVKLQLHFGGDVQEISVPSYDGAEPTVTDLMNVIERDFRVPRALQNLVFHGQDLHIRANDPLSRFGIKNGAAIRLVGRMAPPDLINQINAQYNSYSYQQPYYIQQQNNPYPTYQTIEQDSTYYSEQFQYAPNSSVGTQYDPPAPPTPQNKPPTPQNQPPTPQNKPPVPPTPQNKTPTPNQGRQSERSNGQEQRPSVTPNSSSVN